MAPMTSRITERMIAMGNLATVEECHRCGSKGTVKEQFDKLVSMECPNCGYKWSTMLFKKKSR